MKIFYDGSIFLRQPQGRINSWFEETVSRLPAGVKNVETYLHRFPGTFDRALLKREYFFKPVIGKALLKYDSLLMMLKMKKFKPDIYHSTYYRVPGITDCPKVITICEMRNEILPGGALTAGEKQLLTIKKRCVEQADEIITVSGNVRREITRIYGVPLEKISVVYPGVSEIFKPAAEEEKQAFIAKHNLNLNFILYTGKRAGTKNFDLLFRAFSRWKHSPEFQLICIGPDWDAREKEMISALAISANIRHLNTVDVYDLKMFYSLASAFVYTSKYEGFGTALVEAMACGAPVIAAASSSHPEITGNAAQYFDPNSEQELLAALSRVAEDKRLRRSMREFGLKRSVKFNWDKTARETYEVYKKLLHG
jgi:glycosyltransferase involved in cell wall biosynthesis